MKKHQKNVHSDKKLPDQDKTQISNNVPKEPTGSFATQQSEVAYALEHNKRTDENIAVQEHNIVSVSELTQPHDSCPTECNIQSDNITHGQPLQVISSDAANNQFSYTNDTHLEHHADTMLSCNPQNINRNRSVMGQLMKEDVAVPRQKFVQHEHPLLASMMSVPDISTSSFTQMKSADIINADNLALQVMEPYKDVRHREIISLGYHQDVRNTRTTSLNTSVESTSANNTGDVTLRDLMQ